MLQILLENNDKFTIAEQAQMSIEGGVSWLVLSSVDSEESEIRELACELVPLCRESGTILTIEGHIGMARELGLHGVLLRNGDNPPEVRASLGPEAIIGAETEDARLILAYDKADIDYIAMTTRNPSAIIAEVRKADSTIPFVAVGDFTAEEAKALRLAGYDGICTGKLIFKSENPVEYIATMLRNMA